ncbi:MAG: carbon-nitrogen hydrolase family protein [Acidobacteria bacterium]|nr:carbon-nitrogen hydrolase family protein [Acidobacteriota bacterium]
MAGTKRRWTVAAVQMTSTADRDGNLALAEKLFRRAASSGADLVAFPENFTYLHSEGGKNPFAEDLRGEMLARLRGWAREMGCFLLAGSLPERIPGRTRVFNTSVLISPGGRMVANYRKIHLFDIDLPGRVSLKESSTVAPGNRAVVASTPLGKLGLSICYDLRFPELYRRLARKGAQVIFVPSAFTAYTGRSHWMPLLRARAIENQCWVVAPAQVGRHSRGRESYGHTVILDPWGDVVALKKTGQGLACAEIDLERLRKIRSSLPSLKHMRPHLFGSRLH